MNNADDQQQLKLHEYMADAKAVYTAKSEIYCPYFGHKIALNSDGFIHLQYKPNRQPRIVSEQILKLSLLKKALETIPKIGTLQEYRMQLEKVGITGKSGLSKTKQAKYWGFHAILDGNRRKIKIILKQTGDGKVIFWSVMPFNQKMFTPGIDEL